MGTFTPIFIFLSEIDALNSNMKILDIGSGQGSLLNHPSQHGYEVIGIDANIHKIKKSKLLYGYLHYILADGDALPFESSLFDAVLSFDVFEHIKNTNEHLKEVRRVLKPSGLYLFTTPNKWINYIFEPIRFTKKFGISYASKFSENHCSLHSYWQLKKYFKKNGFEITFYNIQVVNECFMSKLKIYIEKPVIHFLNILNPDKFPNFLRPNFYILASKKVQF